MRGRKFIAGVALAASLTAGAVVVGSPPAQAASQCTAISTTGVGIYVNGVIRQASGGINTQWSFVVGNGCPVSFPAGGELWLRRLRLETINGGCTTTQVASSGWVSFTGLNQFWDYGPLAFRQCFRMQSQARNFNSDYTNHHGKLTY